MFPIPAPTSFQILAPAPAKICQAPAFRLVTFPYYVQSELIYVFSDLTANKIKGVTVHVYICFNPLVFKNNSTNDYIHVGRSRLFYHDSGSNNISNSGSGSNNISNSGSGSS